VSAIATADVCASCRRWPRAAASRRCSNCIALDRERSLARYWRLKATTLCVRCARARKLKGDQRCRPCRDEHRAINRASYRRAHGVTPDNFRGRGRLEVRS